MYTVFANFGFLAGGVQLLVFLATYSNRNYILLVGAFLSILLNFIINVLWHIHALLKDIQAKNTFANTLWEAMHKLESDVPLKEKVKTRKKQ